MNAAAERMPGTPATGQCPSEMAIDAWIMKGRSDADPIGGHVKSCTRCGSLVAEVDGAADVFRREVFPATVDETVRKALAEPLSDRVSAFLFGRRARLVFAAAAAAAVCVVAIGGYFYQDAQQRTQYTGIKGPSTVLRTGGIGLKVFASHAGQVRPLGDNETLNPGDALRFAPAVPADGYLMVVSVEESGKLNLYYPAGGEAAMKVAAGAEPLPGSVVLDASWGAERVFVLYAAEPFSLAQVRDAANRAKGAGVGAMMRLPLDARQATFVFRKAGGR